MHTRRRTNAVRIVAIAALYFLGLSLTSSANAHIPAKKVSSRSPILIGQLAPLSGAFTVPGEYWRAGATLAVRQINAAGGVHGRPLKIVLADDKGTTEGALTAFTWLTQTRHVTAIIGPSNSGEIQALTPAIEQARIPMIIGGGATMLTHEGNPWVFRTRPNSTYSARAQSAFAVNTLHLSRIATLFPSGGGTEVLSDLKALGLIPLTDQSFTGGAPDLTAQVLAIKKSGATGLIAVTLDDANSVQLAHQLHEVGLHLTWVGDAALSTAGTRRMAGSLVYGTYAMTPYAPGQSPEALAFDRYSRATLRLPGDFASAFSYDGVKILAKVMRKVGTKPGAIRRAILALRGYRGAMGTYNFDRNGDGLHQETVVRNVKGRLRVIKVLSF